MKYKYIWTFYGRIIIFVETHKALLRCHKQEIGFGRLEAILLLNSNIATLCHTLIDNLPQFDLSKLNKISSLNNHDVENNIQPDLKYYTLDDFLNDDISQSN